jgi:hydroxymethylpyrimidine pyrophosphatase-like HAD family hydrolase
VKSLAAWPAADARQLLGVLFDLDDTFLDHGRLRVEALTSLYALAASGLKVIGVTGRPSAWGKALALQWPVDALITENGAIAVRRHGEHLELVDWVAPLERLRRQAVLAELVRHFEQTLPELKPTLDARDRLSDFTFDIGETCRAEEALIEQASTLARARGAFVVRSSVHLHISVDADDKASGSLRYLSRCLDIDPTSARHRFAFIGDSENDAAAFAAFEQSFGVANLRGLLSYPPRYRTSQPRARGFVEFTERLLALREQ